MSQIQDRIAQFRKMANDDPDNELGHYRLGQLLTEDKQYGEAIRSFSSVDVAGNAESPQSITVKVDGNDPVTTAALTPAIHNGWYASPTLTRRVEEDDPYFDDLSARWGDLLADAAASIPDPPFMAGLNGH